MTSIKARLNRSHKNKEGLYPLVIQLIRKRKKRELYTPYRLTEKEFDLSSERASVIGRSRNRATYIREANEYIFLMKENLSAILQSLEKIDFDFSVDDLVEAYRHHSDLNCIFVYIDYHAQRLEQEGKFGTAGNYMNTGRSFEKFVGRRLFYWEELTSKILCGYISFLKKRGNSNNTIGFYLRHLRTVYNRAIIDGIITDGSDPFRKIHVKCEETVKRAISPQCISRIVNLDLSNKHVHFEWARDIFLFSLYTRGMSFVDICYLKKVNLRDGYLKYIRRKTGQSLEIKIEQPLKVLIDKYADITSPYLLPVLRNDDSYYNYRYMQRQLNKRIHEIGGMVGISSLTFYVARHSWATTARNKGIPLPIISQGMGHTSETTTRIYLMQIDRSVIDRANKQIIQSWK
ncbi:tyrosine-type recombinase/integrase [Coprobacter tertius]|uniref:Site-specific integrase n=1 Tax=Coprobacter tertius TaxID=2944915 RepID=A0ABT1MK89_9BACT|nr:site-specific integrase [Coprobacter tertius]MCP9613030.1 site-specific integrase [Coprobacter tertius]